MLNKRKCPVEHLHTCVLFAEMLSEDCALFGLKMLISLGLATVNDSRKY